MWLMQFLRDLRAPTNAVGLHCLKEARIEISYLLERTGCQGLAWRSSIFFWQSTDLTNFYQWYIIRRIVHILAEGAIALSVTLSGGALFAS